MPDVIHLSSVAGSPLLDSAGERLGRVEDVVVRMDHGQGLPPVVGLKARIGGRELFVPIDRVEQLGPDAVRDLDDEAQPRPVRAPARRGAAARGRARPQPDQRRHRAPRDGPRGRARLRRRRVARGRDRPEPPPPAVAPAAAALPRPRHRAPAVRLVERHRAVRRPRPDFAAEARRPAGCAGLHPAQIADLVEAASHEEGEEILEAVGEDKELEADVFEELDDEHQVEFLRERSDKEAAEVLARMATDDAADLLLELDQERRIPILNLLPAAKQRKIRSLLGYNPSTAGRDHEPGLRLGARGRNRRRGARAGARERPEPAAGVDRLRGRRAGEAGGDGVAGRAGARQPRPAGRDHRRGVAADGAGRGRPTRRRAA